MELVQLIEWLFILRTAVFNVSILVSRVLSYSLHGERVGDQRTLERRLKMTLFQCRISIA